MAQYDNSKHKIYKIWQNTIQNKDDVKNLKKEQIKTIQANYNSKVSKYTIYDGSISSADPIIFKVNLSTFPEITIPYIKIIPITNSSDSIVESFVTPTYTYIYYQGIASDVKIYLILKFPQDYNQIKTNSPVSGTGVRG